MILVFPISFSGCLNNRLTTSLLIYLAFTLGSRYPYPLALNATEGHPLDKIFLQERIYHQNRNAGNDRHRRPD